MPDPKQKSNTHQSPTLSCSDTPKPGFFSPGQNLLCKSRGYNLMLTQTDRCICRNDVKYLLTVSMYIGAK